MLLRVLPVGGDQIPNLTSFDQRHHLSWGDVAVDNISNPSVIKVHLKRSKCDQLQRGVDVYQGRAGGDLCPVAAVMHYVSRRGPVPGCFFLFGDSSPLTKGLQWSQFPDWCYYDGGPGGGQRLDDSDAGQVE